jgi:hypothetical protein
LFHRQKKGEAEGGDGSDQTLVKHFAAIGRVAPQLVFPTADKTPVLEIPEPVKPSKGKSA